MPVHAYIEATVKCPSCGSTDLSSEMENLVQFQWGYCPGQLPQKQYIYHLGDLIYWRPCSDGTIPAWKFFIIDGYQDGGNVGDLSVKDLLVRDSEGAYSFVRPCPTCGERFSGFAVDIRGGIIQSLWLCKPGEMIGNAYKIINGLLLLPGELNTADYERYIAINQKHADEMTDEDKKLKDDLNWQIFYRPDYYVISADNSLQPMPEWNDHRMPSINIECQEVDFEGNILPTPTD